MKYFNGNILTTALPLVTTAVAVSGCSSEKKEMKRPNIIVIMTDDHTTQAIGAYGGKLMPTPNLDRIANEGMRFDNCYVTNAISGPSRACILTGKMSHLNGFTDNSQSFDGSQQTFPKLLNENGYQTAMIGKWHLTSNPEGFDHWSTLIGQGEYYNPDFIENGDTIQEPGYVTDVITRKALDYIKQRDASRPFAMLFYQKAPHRNWIPSPENMGIYNDVVFPEPATLHDDYASMGQAAKEQQMHIYADMWTDQDLKIADTALLRGKQVTGRMGNKADMARANQKGDGIAQLRADFSRMSPEAQKRFVETYKKRNEEWKSVQKLSQKEIVSWKYQQYMQDYLATCLSVDQSVGKLLEYLEQIGELDNTIIIYTSDQGFFLGEHGWFDKRFMYEECQRMPFMVRYPKSIKAGSTSSALSMNIDFAPTILDFAGVAIPEDIQGRSLKGVMESDGSAPKDWREAVYYHYYEYPSWHSVKRHYGVRTNDYKLIHFYNDIDQYELYDMRGGATESRNVYNDPAYAKVREDMTRLLKKTAAEYKDTDPTEEEIVFFNGI